jgi:anthranilate synthase component 1
MTDPYAIPADLDTPVSAYLKLRPFRPRFLLESVEGGERLGRYSFLGFGEGLEVRLDGRELRLAGESRPAPEDPRALLGGLRDALERAPRPVGAGPAAPLAGGLVGYAGYDLVRRLERLPARRPDGAGAPEAAWIAPRSLLVFDHVTRTISLRHDGDEAERRALHREIVRALRGAVPGDRIPRRYEPARASLSRGGFVERVERAQEAIRAGEVYQLVLSVQFGGACELPPFEVYRALRRLNPSPYTFFLELDDVAVVGSSPEALVRLDGRAAALRPIAGTRPRGRTDEEDAALERELLADAKEAAEHVMLVDLARNDLGRVAVAGSVTVQPSRIIERYSHVMHLVSGVTGVLAPKADQLDLFAATFPAGTVVGAPKIRAMELIDELEPVGRGVYAGTVGYFGRGGAMDQAIAIRTLTFANGRYAYQSGAGIVADSVPEREHDEVLAKSAALGAALHSAAHEEVCR